MKCFDNVSFAFTLLHIFLQFIFFGYFFEQLEQNFPGFITFYNERAEQEIECFFYIIKKII